VRSPDVVFMFPGQGSQYINMGLNLYQRESVFSAAVDRCAEILKPLLKQDLRDIIYPADGEGESAETALRQTVYTQPALFTIEYALAQLWLSWGIQPVAMIGHSIGEFVAACLAGLFPGRRAETGGDPRAHDVGVTTGFNAVCPVSRRYGGDSVNGRVGDRGHQWSIPLCGFWPDGGGGVTPS
jgi:pimeloyl-ACP methyl ester carboxylesterase